MRERINSQIKEEMGKNQREYVLRQQLKAIGRSSARTTAIRRSRRLEERIAKANLPNEAEQVAKKQLKRLRNMQVGSAEYTVVRTYPTGSSTCPGTTRRRTTSTSRPSAGPRRGPLRPREGQEAHPRVPRRPQAEEGQEGPDPRLPASARPVSVRRRSVGRSRARSAASSTASARRRARRGGDPRSPPHVRRRAPRPGHPGHEEGRARSTWSSCSTRSTRSATTSAAILRRRLLEVLDPSRTTLRGPLPRDPVRPLERDVRRDGERRGSDPAAAPRPHGDPRDPRLHAEREARHRASTSSRSRSRSTASRRRQLEITDRRGRHHHRPLHARRRASATSSVRWRRSSAAWR